MAKKRSLEDVTTYEEEPVIEAPVVADSVDTKQCKHYKRKKHRTEAISSKSPIVYLSPTVKEFLSKFKMTIMMTENSHITENDIVRDALLAYSKKENKEFYEKYKSIIG